MGRSRGCKRHRTGTAVAEASGQDGDKPQSRIAVAGELVNLTTSTLTMSHARANACMALRYEVPGIHCKHYKLCALQLAVSDEDAIEAVLFTFGDVLSHVHRGLNNGPDEYLVGYSVSNAVNNLSAEVLTYRYDILDELPFQASMIEQFQLVVSREGDIKAMVFTVPHLQALCGRARAVVD